MESVHERNFAAICIIQNIKGLKRSKAILETDMACEVGMLPPESLMGMLPTIVWITLYRYVTHQALFGHNFQMR